MNRHFRRENPASPHPAYPVILCEMIIILNGNQGKANANHNEVEFHLHQNDSNISYTETHALWNVICQKLL